MTSAKNNISYGFTNLHLEAFTAKEVREITEIDAYNAKKFSSTKLKLNP